MGFCWCDTHPIRDVNVKIVYRTRMMCIFENQFDFFEIVWGMRAMTV